jgi:hypothetical protein
MEPTPFSAPSVLTSQPVSQSAPHTPGWRTSEFWLTILFLALVLEGAIEGLLPPAQAVTVGGIATAFWAVLRTFLKFQVTGFNLRALSDAVEARNPAPLVQETPKRAQDYFPRVEESPESAAPSLNALLFLIGAALAAGGCTTLYERGQKVASFGSNLKALEYRSAGGSTLKASTLDNAVIIRATGSAVAGAAIGLGTAAATSGATTLLK